MESRICVKLERGFTFVSIREEKDTLTWINIQFEHERPLDYEN